MLAWILFSSLWWSSVTAETILLRDGTSLQGSIEHVYKGIYTIITPEGPKVIGQHEIVNIEFPAEIPLAQPEPLPETPASHFLQTIEDNESPYGSPLNTFSTWRTAAIAGKLEEMVKCYASFRQGAVRKKLKGISKQDWEDTRAATANTEFLPKAPMYQGDRAFMEVAWTRNLQGDTQTLKFILENDEWKLME